LRYLPMGVFSKNALVAAFALAAQASQAAGDDFAPMALNSFTVLPMRFPSARVMGQDGALLGNVQAVQSDLGGKPTTIRIGVAGGRIISLRSDEASYDESGNIVVTDFEATKAAIAAVGSPSP
jgi:hypothetical protein